nr:hypothetical protein L204_03060 [Cryptococcus depauperatus CBS 7855]
MNLLALLLVLPTLVLAHNNSPLHHRSPSRKQHESLAAVVAFEDGSGSPILRRTYPGVIEEKMARKRAGKFLAKRNADPSKCRKKGDKYTPALASTTTTISTSVSSSVTNTVTDASTSVITDPSSAWQTPQPTTPNGQDGAGNRNSGQVQNPPGPSDNGGSKNSVVAHGNLTPNGNKAGLSAGDALPFLKHKIGWWYGADWSPNPSGDCGNAVSIPMLWGGGFADATDAARLSAFQSISGTPAYIIGFEEPDCTAGSGSAGMDVGAGISLWNSLVAPHGYAGSILIGPSMCKQAAESGWLKPFMDGVSKKPDIMNIHVNKNNADGIKADINHYWNTYGLPMSVTEFACVDDSTGFVPCENQNEINNFIYTAVDIFETDSRIVGYAYSNGYGLSDPWTMVKNGQLTESGQTYLNAISKYH